jgi:drug/metabolite transporter (DMT)-like permease
VRWNLLLAGLAASWGFIAVLVAAVDLDAEALAFARLALAALTLAAVAMLGAGRDVLRPGGRLPALVALGAAQGAHWLLFFLAVKHGSVALAVLTFYAAPLVIAVSAPLALGERVSRVALLALVPGAAGIALVALGAGPVDGEGGASAAAVAAGLGAAVTYAALVILSKRLLQGRAEPLAVAFWDCLVGALVVAPALLLAGRVVPSGAEEWSVVLLLGVVFTGVSTLAYVSLLRHVTAQAAGLLTFLEPVAAVALAAALLDEPLGPAVLAGGALVLAAGAVVVLLERPEEPVAEAVAAVGSGET